MDSSQDRLRGLLGFFDPWDKNSIFEDCDDDLPKMMLLQTHHLEAKVRHAKDEIATRQELSMAYASELNWHWMLNAFSIEERSWSLPWTSISTSFWHFEVPFNFGHTVSVKALEEGIRWGDCGSRVPLSATSAEETEHKTDPSCCVADFGRGVAEAGCSD